MHFNFFGLHASQYETAGINSGMQETINSTELGHTPGGGTQHFGGIYSVFTKKETEIRGKNSRARLTYL